jgi:hypothetical protein
MILYGSMEKMKSPGFGKLRTEVLGGFKRMRGRIQI